MHGGVIQVRGSWCRLYLYSGPNDETVLLSFKAAALTEWAFRLMVSSAFLSHIFTGSISICMTCLFLIGKYSHDRVLSRFNESKKPRTRVVRETIRSFTYSIYSFNIVIDYFSVELIIADRIS